MKYIYVGKIVNTHGIKGELRIISQFKFKNKIFKKEFPIYIGNDRKEEIITSYRPHKQFDMITLLNYTNINEVLKYKGSNVYINEKDLELNDNEYLDENLIGLKAQTNGEFIGAVTSIIKGIKQNILVINGKKEYLIPLVSDIIESVDFNKKEITINNIKGLIE